MQESKLNKETLICDIILGMNNPFKTSELFTQMALSGINNEDLIVDILGQLYESGLISSTFEDDVFRYKVTRK